MQYNTPDKNIDIRIAYCNILQYRDRVKAGQGPGWGRGFLG